MINASMVEAGFCINKHGGAYENGKTNSIQVNAVVAAKYFEMEENLVVGERVSVNALAAASKCSWHFANKVVRDIQSGQLVNPRTVVSNWAHGVGGLSLSEDYCLYFLALRRFNTLFTLRDYVCPLAMDKGTSDVEASVRHCGYIY